MRITANNFKPDFPKFNFGLFGLNFEKGNFKVVWCVVANTYK